MWLFLWRGHHIVVRGSQLLVYFTWLWLSLVTQNWWSHVLDTQCVSLISLTISTLHSSTDTHYGNLLILFLLISDKTDSYELRGSLSFYDRNVTL